MPISLQVASGRNAGQEIQVRGSRFLIGRAEDCHLRAHSDQISRYHCALLIQKQGVFIRDYGSRNGTFVDGQRIFDQQALNDGQQLQVGPLSFIVRIPPGSAIGSRPGKDTVTGKASSDTVHVSGKPNPAGAAEAAKSVKQAAHEISAAPEPLDVMQFLAEPEARPEPSQARADAVLPSVEDFLAEQNAAEKAAGQSETGASASDADQTRDAALEGLKKFYSPKRS
jgi:pSer/pThr/pTyr-binding forkhead associated (FHA) protein